ncbi:MAG: hypothetical protein D6719_12200 [Candidatus Dadabacteria bacterium]|nr:MAG: hypothetical protein D6719_12200 [Candidatus Dadabacteria bacterium]
MTTKKLSIKSPEIFYDSSTLKKELLALKNLPEKERAYQLYSFIKKHHHHSTPLYDSFQFHHTARYLSTFGSGYCDDAATAIAYAARELGLKARTWWLTGHVVSEIFYNNSWHLFDADELGVLKDKGEIAGIDYWIKQAQENRLPRFNDVYSTLYNNRIETDAVLQPQQDWIVTVDLYPGERRFYFKKAYLLTTNGKFLEKRLNSKQKFFREYRAIGNYVRKIPLKALVNGKEPVQLTDVFPLSGVFLVTANQDKLSTLPLIKLDSSLINGVIWQGPQIYFSKGLNAWIYDLSTGVKNLEHLPSFKAEIKNLRKIFKEQPDAYLLAVYFYSVSNARFSPTNLQQLKADGLSIELNPHYLRKMQAKNLLAIPERS